MSNVLKRHFKELCQKIFTPSIARESLIESYQQSQTLRTLEESLVDYLIQARKLDRILHVRNVGLSYQIKHKTTVHEVELFGGRLWFVYEFNGEKK